MLREILSIVIAIVVAIIVIRLLWFILGIILNITVGFIMFIIIAAAAIPLYFVVKKALFKK